MIRKTSAVTPAKTAFNEEWDRIIANKDSDRDLKAMAFARSLSREMRRRLLFRLPALFKNGEANLVVNIYEELGMASVGAYYRSKALDLGLNAANNGAVLYVYHMQRGHEALAMNYLLIGARKAGLTERAILLKKVVANLDHSNWGRYYREKVRVECLEAEMRLVAMGS